MNKYVVETILTLTLVGTVAMQNASAQKSAAFFLEMENTITGL